MDDSIKKAARAILSVFKQLDKSEGGFVHYEDFGPVLRVEGGHVKHENQREALMYLRTHGYVDEGDAGLTLTEKGAGALEKLR